MSQLDRERERKALKKRLRGFKDAFRKRFKREPTAEELDAMSKSLARPGYTVPIAPAQSLPGLPVQQAPAKPKLTITEVGRITARGIEGLSDEDAKAIAPQAKYIWHTSRFQDADTHAEQLVHLQGALIGLMERAGIRDPFIEAPAIIAALADIDDQLAGREGRLLQAVADPVRPVTASAAKAESANKLEPSNRWIASAFIVGLGLAVEKFAGLTKKPALLKVITDLEDAARLNAPLDTFFAEGNPTVTTEDIGAREARRNRLIKRFGDDHRSKLTNGDVPTAAKWTFDMLTKEIARETAEHLREHYPLWLLKASPAIRQARERPDTKRKPKGGSRRLEAKERKEALSTDA